MQPREHMWSQTHAHWLTTKNKIIWINQGRPKGKPNFCQIFVTNCYFLFKLMSSGSRSSVLWLFCVASFMSFLVRIDLAFWAPPPYSQNTPFCFIRTINLESESGCSQLFLRTSASNVPEMFLFFVLDAYLNRYFSTKVKDVQVY